MNYAPEHHPYYPRFHSFENGDIEGTAPDCTCEECRKCRGCGYSERTVAQAGDQSLTECEDCINCDGFGRILTHP